MKRIVLVILCISLLSISCGDNKKPRVAQSTTPEKISTELTSFLKSGLAENTKPGTLLKTQELKNHPADIKMWRIVYASMGVAGVPVKETAMVYAPAEKSSAARNVIVFAHGTTGIADICAPSRIGDPTATVSLFDDYIRKGYAVIEPDYEGLGSPGVHPFLVGDSEGKSVLDAARVITKFSPVKTKDGSVIVGHSQGGHAALFAGELHKSYAPDVKIDGITAIAPVGKLSFIFPQASQSSATLGFIVMGGIGFKAAYPDLDLGTILSADVIKRSAVIDKQCLPSILATYGNDPKGSIVGDPAVVQPWPELFAKNSPGARKIDVPLFIVHGLTDSTVPSFISQEVKTSLCTLGTKVQRKTYSGSGATHSGVISLARKDIMSFIDDRFTNKTFVDGCDVN